MNIEKRLEEFIIGLEKARPKVTYLAPIKERKTAVIDSIKTIVSMVLHNDENAKFSVSPDDLTGTSVDLSIITEYVEFHPIPEFVEAVKVATTYEVLPAEEEGKVEINFSYNGVYRIVGKEY